MGKVLAVCISKEKQTKKKDIKESLILKNFGLKDDAHADSSSHRQVSLLAQESIDKIQKNGFNVKKGDFAENITTSGIDLKSLKIGTVLSVGEKVQIKVTQIGKECHSPCAIYHQMGHCVMPSEGIFAIVLREGLVKVGDEIKID
ncbi:MOSC domain-containing protein [Methanobacterium alcaliphilum]|uniref:MOSC domain-containing protein n=1 Tax=Methanobacterium alcaliphilum TaxID=392018 RepID=UPI00200AB826|nr:MOSC domain-containing protein [Methanobacterium alcaliphilum]MCK9150718.1 MOSC domain-containing protein [Methanobacterium alcaliphilum]